MNYGNIKECDIADGPGVRVSLFVSGCRHHCKGCFNEETWNFNYGQPYTEETEAEILNSLDSNFIQGFTLLGGEPFEPENQVELVKLLKKVRETQGDSLRIIKIDIDKNMNIAQHYAISSVPTLMIFKNGKQLWRQSGVIEANELNKIVEMFK